MTADIPANKIPIQQPSSQPELALVTGAGHRLGRAIAIELGHQGYAVVLHYNRSEEGAERTAAELKEAGVQVYLIRADLTSPRQVETLFDRVGKIGFPLRVLVNSAAVMPRESVLSISATEWDATLALNLRAPLLCAQHAVKLMETGGVIINISDSGAHKAWTGFPAYVVSKAALETLTRLLARALAPKIRVNAVAPGLILPSQELSPEDWERLVGRIPLQRPGAPEEIGQAVAFLLKNQYITGQTLVVDGGYQIL